HGATRAVLALAFGFLTPGAGKQIWYNVSLLPADALRLEGAVEHPLYPRAVATVALCAAERGDAPTAERLADAALAAAERLASPHPGGGAFGVSSSRVPSQTNRLTC